MQTPNDQAISQTNVERELVWYYDSEGFITLGVYSHTLESLVD